MKMYVFMRKELREIVLYECKKVSKTKSVEKKLALITT